MKPITQEALHQDFMRNRFDLADLSKTIGWWRTSIIVLITLSLAGCSNPIATDGPLAMGGRPGQVCIPDPTEGLAVVGAVIRNTGDTNVALDRTSLIDPVGLSAVEAYAISMDYGDTAVGATSTRPETQAAKRLWRSKSHLNSVVLKPGEAANILVSLRLENEHHKGRAAAIELTYAFQGTAYIAQSSTRILLAPESCF